MSANDYISGSGRDGTPDSLALDTIALRDVATLKVIGNAGFLRGAYPVEVEGAGEALYGCDDPEHFVVLVSVRHSGGDLGCQDHILYHAPALRGGQAMCRHDLTLQYAFEREVRYSSADLARAQRNVDAWSVKP